MRNSSTRVVPTYYCIFCCDHRSFRSRVYRFVSMSTTYLNICWVTKSFLTLFFLLSQLTSMELQGFYGHDTDTSSLSNGEPGSLKHSSPFLLHSGVANKPAGTTTTQTLKFHNHFPPDTHKWVHKPCHHIITTSRVILYRCSARMNECGNRIKWGMYPDWFISEIYFNIIWLFSKSHQLSHVWCRNRRIRERKCVVVNFILSRSLNNTQLHFFPLTLPVWSEHVCTYHWPTVAYMHIYIYMMHVFLHISVSYYNSEKKEVLDQSGLTTDGTVFSSPPNKRTKLVPPINERVMLYVRQDAEDVYTPLHVIPPTTQGLLNAVSTDFIYYWSTYWQTSINSLLFFFIIITTIIIIIIIFTIIVIIRII